MPDIIGLAFLKALVSTLLCQTTTPMVNGNCAVVGCTSSKYQLRLWGENICEQYLGALKKECHCSPPFRLLSFPSIKRNMSKRKEWTRLIHCAQQRRKHAGILDRVMWFAHFILLTANLHLKILIPLQILDLRKTP